MAVTRSIISEAIIFFVSFMSITCLLQAFSGVALTFHLRLISFHLLFPLFSAEKSLPVFCRSHFALSSLPKTLFEAD